MSNPVDAAAEIRIAIAALERAAVGIDAQATVLQELARAAHTATLQLAPLCLASEEATQDDHAAMRRLREVLAKALGARLPEASVAELSRRYLAMLPPDAYGLTFVDVAQHAGAVIAALESANTGERLLRGSARQDVRMILAALEGLVGAVRASLCSDTPKEALHAALADATEMLPQWRSKVAAWTAASGEHADDAELRDDVTTPTPVAPA